MKVIGLWLLIPFHVALTASIVYLTIKGEEYIGVRINAIDGFLLQGTMDLFYQITLFHLVALSSLFLWLVYNK